MDYSFIILLALIVGLVIFFTTKFDSMKRDMDENDDKPSPGFAES